MAFEGDRARAVKVNSDEAPSTRRGRRVGDGAAEDGVERRNMPSPGGDDGDMAIILFRSASSCESERARFVASTD